MVVGLSVTRAKLLAEANELVRHLRGGFMSSTAYDTAWCARLAARADASPYDVSVYWLLANQHDDGSWGGAVFHLPDRVVCTLASVIALEINRPRRPDVEPAINAGVAFLNGHLADLEWVAQETGGYEMLVPSLHTEARALGLGISTPLPPRVLARRAEKLQGIPAAAMYSRQASFVHNLEVLGDGLIAELARPIQSGDGSFGSSPSATAYFLTHAQSPEADAYLSDVMELSGDGGVGNVYPFDVFEHAWVLWNLRSMGDGLEHRGRLLTHLAGVWRPGGIGFSSHCHIIESDCTAVAFRVLRGNALKVDPAVFRLFEADDFFYGFPFERGHSTSANAHILEAVRIADPSPEVDRFAQKAAGYLERSQEPDGHWLDKWHISPYYATAQAIVALNGYRNSLAASGAEWLLATQHFNGGWGFGAGTDEETAYATIALLNAPRLLEHRQSDWHTAVTRAGEFLMERLDDQDYPELWVGKALYSPKLVVRSAILGALDRYLQATHRDGTSAVALDGGVARHEGSAKQAAKA